MIRTLLAPALGLVSLSIFSPVAAAQAPDACGMTEADASYGTLTVGTEVTLQRHRFVRGDDNWDTQMDRFLGRAAHVTRLSGVDAAGCPGIRVDLDGGQYFWRIRDVGIGIGLQPLPSVAAAEFPQQCHQNDANADYGAAIVGATVVLGRHRPVDGETNWAEEMQPFVGRTAHVAQLGGTDTSGCPGVRVDIDGQQWFWRVRDLHGEGHGGVVAFGEYAPSLGVTTDHGRPPSVGTGIFGSGGVPGPQECGLSEGSIVWAPIAIGAQVVIGRHREVNGDANWDPAMEPYVGSTAHVTQLAGADDQGCPVVRIDVDNQSFVWRVRDMTVTPGATGSTGPSGWSGLPTYPHECGMATASYGSLTIGARVILGRHTPWTGPDGQGGSVTADTDWSEEMNAFVGQPATVTSFESLDSAGCPVVHVDLDGGQWLWRIRDLTPAP